MMEENAKKRPFVLFRIFAVFSRFFQPIRRAPRPRLRVKISRSAIFCFALALLYLTDGLGQSATSFLQAANRLSFLDNWDAAGPLYVMAEHLYKAEGDLRNEIYARVGRIRAQAAAYTWEEVSQSLDEQLRIPVVQADKELRLWCLATKGYVDLDLDIASAKRSWTEALQIADALGERQWAARAQGELGIISFLEGDTGTAVSLVGKALLSALATGDTGEQVRLLAMLGNGYNEVHRFQEGLWFLQHAISITKNTPGAGFPYLAYEGRATALAGSGKPAEAQRLLKEVLLTARRQNRRDEEAEVLVLLGETSTTRGDMEEAKDEFEAARRIAEDALYYPILAEAMFDEAAIYKNQGKLKAASALLMVGLQASRRLGDRYYLPRDLTALAEVRAAAKEDKGGKSAI